jgi:hypothetical protein
LLFLHFNMLQKRELVICALMMHSVPKILSAQDYSQRLASATEISFPWIALVFQVKVMLI